MREEQQNLDRRQFLKVSGSVAAAGVLGAEMGVNQTRAATNMPASSPAPAFALASAPLLLNPCADGITVVVAVNAPATGWVEYGPTQALGRRADGEISGLLPFEQRVLSFRLNGLSPGQAYYYRVHACQIDFQGAYSIKRGSEVSSEVFTFRTLDPGADRASFTIWNDTHETDQTIKSLAASLIKSPTDLLMWNGDICNDVADDEKIISQFISPAGGVAYANQTPLFVGRGNHDVRGGAARRLGALVPGPEGEYFYQFRHGPLAAVVMDTGEDKPDDHPAYAGLAKFESYRAHQQQWLAKAIDEPQFTSAPFRVAFLHIPLVWEAEVPNAWVKVYGPGVRGWVCDDGLAKWHDLLVRGKIDLVISGHTHQHGWFPPHSKRPYGQLVGGGPKPAEATSIVGRAYSDRLEIVMRDLDGKVLLQHHIRRET